MKRSFFGLFAVILTMLTAGAAHIRTVNGVMYFDVRFRKVTHKGLIFMHRDGVVTLTPDKFNRLDLKRYASQIAEYNQKSADENQRLFAAEVAELKKFPLPKRMFKGYEMLDKYRNAPFDLRELMRVVKDAEQKSYAADMTSCRSMPPEQRVSIAEGLLKKYARRADFVSEIKDSINDAKREIFDNDVAAWRKMNLPDRVKYADVLQKRYAAVPDFIAAIKLELASVKLKLQGALDNAVQRLDRLSFAEQYLGCLNLLSEYNGLPVNTLKLMSVMENARKHIPAEYEQKTAELAKCSIYDQASRGEMLLQRYKRLDYALDYKKLSVMVELAKKHIASIRRDTENISRAMASAKRERYYEHAIAIMERAIGANPLASNLNEAKQYLENLRGGLANVVVGKHTDNITKALSEARKSRYYESAITELRKAIKNNPQASNLAQAEKYLNELEILWREKKQRLAAKQRQINAMSSGDIRTELISFINRWLSDMRMKRDTSFYWLYPSLGKVFFNVSSWQVLGTKNGYWNSRINTVIVQIDSSTEGGMPIRVNREIIFMRDDELNWKISVISN